MSGFDHIEKEAFHQKDKGTIILELMDELVARHPELEYDVWVLEQRNFARSMIRMGDTMAMNAVRMRNLHQSGT